mmetsp:Transcript_9435/g.25590  ORF Transcript_9435/g.25590 Transcript_9435/m.25590 type:complete len:276 (-) Transcript_9435:341-1168(-)
MWRGMCASGLNTLIGRNTPACTRSFRISSCLSRTLLSSSASLASKYFTFRCKSSTKSVSVCLTFGIFSSSLSLVFSSCSLFTAPRRYNTSASFLCLLLEWSERTEVTILRRLSHSFVRKASFDMCFFSFSFISSIFRSTFIRARCSSSSLAHAPCVSNTILSTALAISCTAASASFTLLNGRRERADSTVSFTPPSPSRRGTSSRCSSPPPPLLPRVNTPLWNSAFAPPADLIVFGQGGVLPFPPPPPCLDGVEEGEECICAREVEEATAREEGR